MTERNGELLEEKKTVQEYLSSVRGWAALSELTRSLNCSPLKNPGLYNRITKAADSLVRAGEIRTRVHEEKRDGKWKEFRLYASQL